MKVIDSDKFLFAMKEMEKSMTKSTDNNALSTVFDEAVRVALHAVSAAAEVAAVEINQSAQGASDD